MSLSRRSFLQFVALSGGAATGLRAAPASASSPRAPSAGAVGCLVDLAECDGCRLCEKACNEQNLLPPPDRPFEDRSVLATRRRPSERALTVVNRFDPGAGAAPVFVKTQCMHCVDPACVSACIVGALVKQPDGPVTYDAEKCIGCRYCMVACPFQMAAYEYDDPLAPRLRKCTLCFERVSRGGGLPACAAICPKEAIRYGPRAELVRAAHSRIESRGTPDRPHPAYVPRVYGEHEVGGTSWLYISAVPFQRLGFLELPLKAAPRLTEAIQHGIFRHFLAPVALVSILGLIMRLFGERPRPAAPAERRAD